MTALHYPAGQGRWPMTASIQWCEEDYTVSYWIAEFVNTISNIPFMALGFYGIGRAIQEGLPLRVALSYSGLLVVGAGSFLFHMTLMWVFQLCDELPMIGFSSFLAWSVFNIEPGYANTAFSMASLAAVFLADLAMAITYVRNPKPLLHQVAFGLIMLTLVARTSWLIKHRLPEREREKVTSLYSRGALLFLFGFACWQVDENFCGSLQAVRSYLGPTLGAATELHAWWHLFTGLGSYQMVSAATLLVLSVKSPSERFELVPSFGGLLPYVRRVDSSRKKR